jgi:RNA polymerase sigma-70 factor (ECF subfamily)
MATAVAGVRVKKTVYDSTEELDLVHRAKQGDELAFQSLYNAHHTRVVVTITRFVKDDDAAMEIANSTLFKAWRALPRFEEHAKFSTWITRIAINEARMHLRSGKRRQREVSLDTLLSGGLDEGASGNSSDASYAQRWLAIRDLELAGIADRQLLERAIGQVPEKLRELLRLKFWEGLSLDEIQAKVSAGQSKLVSISAVKSRLLRARKMLIEEVKQIS